MFKKSLVLVCMLMGLSASAELPRRLSQAQMRSIITGNGILPDGQKTCRLERNFEQIHLPRYATTQVSQREVLALLDSHPDTIQRDDETLTHAHVSYIIWNEHPSSNMYQVTFKCA